jgi:hypothetical protein
MDTGLKIVPVCFRFIIFAATRIPLAAAATENPGANPARADECSPNVRRWQLRKDR